MSPMVGEALFHDDAEGKVPLAGGAGAKACGCSLMRGGIVGIVQGP